LYWQSFQGLVNQGDESSATISKQLDSCYPNNVDKQRDLLIAIIEILDDMDRDKTISVDALIRIAMKWQVERVVCEEMAKAITKSSSILLKETEDRHRISRKNTLQAD
jgi:hypothetical protein